MDDVSMVYFRAADGTALADARDALREAGLDVQEAAGALVVRWDDGPELRVTRHASPAVGEAAAALAKAVTEAALARCDARFEIAVDDLDEVLDEINTLIETQSTLQRLTAGWLYDGWNDALQGPDDARRA